MRNFNLAKVSGKTELKQFTPAQEDFFLDCYLNALNNPQTPALENIGAAALGGLIGGLIGLIWGIYNHFFGKQGKMDSSIERFEFNYKFDGAKMWNDAWEKVKREDAEAKKKLVDSLANNPQFQNLVNRNAFHLDIFPSKQFCRYLVGVGEVLNLVCSSSIPTVYSVNKVNLAAHDDKMIKSLEMVQKELVDDGKKAAELAQTDFDDTDIFTIMKSIKTATMSMRGDTVNMDANEYRSQAEKIVNMGDRAIDVFSGIREIVDPYQKIIEKKQKAILHDLDRAKSSLGNGEEDPEVARYKKDLLHFVSSSMSLIGSILQYLVYDLDQRSAYVELITKELQKQKTSAEK